MSLATRCTACGTVFRVVQDQLKISEGWVRCGRCKDVFNALEGLFDLERDAPPQWKPAATGEAAEAHRGAARAPLSQGDADEAPAGALLSASIEAPAADAPHEVAAAIETARLHEPDGAAAEAQSSIDSEPRDSRDFADARFNIELALDDGADDPALAATAAPEAAEPAATVGQEPPAFLREAAENARWRRPRVRLALGAAALLLLACLGAQWLLHDRDRIAAEWPAVRPLLAAACDALGCRIEAPRRIEDIAVESSALTRASLSGNVEALRLVVALRNRGTLALTIPTVNLSLTDGNGELVARRALSATDFHSPSRALAPAGETTLQTLLANPGGRITGYTVEVFYP